MGYICGEERCLSRRLVVPSEALIALITRAFDTAGRDKRQVISIHHHPHIFHFIGLVVITDKMNLSAKCHC